MKTYLKTFARMFKRHITRFISVFLMVLISIGFSAGIGMATDKMMSALDRVYREKNVSDFIIRGEDDLSERADAFEALGYEVTAGGMIEFRGGETFTQTRTESSFPVTIDVDFEGLGDAGIVRAYFFDSEEDLFRQNRLTVLEESTEPLEEGLIPVSVERGTEQLCGFRLGDKLGANVAVAVQTPMGAIEDRNEYAYVVTRIVENPLHLAVRQDPSTFAVEGEEDEYEELGAVFYITGQTFSVMGQTASFPANSLYLSLPSLKDSGSLFSDRYETALAEEKAKVEAEFDDLLTENAKLGILTLHENFTFESYDTYAEKVEMIGYALMVVFVLVTLLVVLSTMTRLLEEERAQIACLSTLGYSAPKILTKYLLFAAVGTVLGAAGGYGASIGLAYIIYINFTWNFAMPPFPAGGSVAFFMIVASIILVSTVAATLIAGHKMTRIWPAALLRPKTPKPGKKVILEHIPLLWNHLSFKYKSTLRNVLRFKVRFAMTVIAVMASTGLVLAGLAVLDCCIFQDIGTAAMIGVGIVVLLFAALLNFVVIYTLTNINISERERELATLMVLGYHTKEVAMYVYREIYITSAIGILLGIPFGALLCAFVFSLMSLGSLAAINVYVWFVAPVMSLLFTFLVTLVLRWKISRIRMNESLKAIE